MAKVNRAIPLLILLLITACAIAVLPVKAEAKTIVIPDDYGTIAAQLQTPPPERPTELVGQARSIFLHAHL